MSKTSFTAAELAERLGGDLRNCPGDRVLGQVLPLDQAGSGALSFLANPKYHARALQSGAGLILVDPGTDLGDRPQLVMKNAYWGFAQVLGWLHPEPEPEWSDAPVHPTAKLGRNCRVAPGATVGARTVVGDGARIHPGVHIAEDCVLGEDCVLFPGVVLYRGTILGNRVRIHANSVLGSDGFGYVPVQGVHRKIPQVGWVEVGDDVEIGATSTVDRGALGPTRIAAGTKIDNLCQVAHNVQIGEHCVIASMTGISGSTTLGHHVTLAGKVGTAGHIHIGSGSVLTGNTMVGKDVPDNSFMSGYLARPHKQWLECQAALNRLPALVKALKART
ncbi:UDP-3-O-(3-hydroxymyristoyl)glucosamine N-acyltransferase [Mesoterricola silvestris]|uniref:UDP-3-O-acylglucosamine N-acyltransferase n=1 Tax=Mesoterricola silvestris TaxID=2927979 RepID=A0AA48GNA2_9BACT|nr:UDP-3-O-(3-hydroxymyristoyl)glucosamine N-acyltransferase [Mesoterricola silvestris]BDU74484.1 UDP-3-O-acylglucosamine N-acyltransferase [Mesoterricola silvestris]